MNKATLHALYSRVYLLRSLIQENEQRTENLFNRSAYLAELRAELEDVREDVQRYGPLAHKG